jgi:hypothetical protein
MAVLALQPNIATRFGEIPAARPVRLPPADSLVRVSQRHRASQDSLGVAQPKTLWQRFLRRADIALTRSNADYPRAFDYARDKHLSPLRQVMLLMIDTYQYLTKPDRENLGKGIRRPKGRLGIVCGYRTTCSEYTAEQIRKAKHLSTALYKGFIHILNCNGFHRTIECRKLGLKPDALLPDSAAISSTPAEYCHEIKSWLGNFFHGNPK